MKKIRVEKRIPFGFKGEWGQVYKAFNYEETAAVFSDPLAGEWLIFENPALLDPRVRWSVDFTSNGKTYDTLEIMSNYIFYGLGNQLNSAYVLDYDGKGEWKDENYRTVRFTSTLSEVENGEALVKWLQANATRIPDSTYIEWNKTAYIDIGQDVQFKYLENGIDKQRYFTQTEENIVVKSDYRIVETTDAYFNDETGEFECVVDIGDIVCLFERWWVVDNIDEKSIFTPAKQTFFYLGLKRIHEKIIRRN